VRQYRDGLSPKDPIITLLTDFGLQDEYVGVMKGVIASIVQDARIIDISHGIHRHDIRQAALVLYSAYRFFPKGTIHVAVIDPGVGGHRRILCLKQDSHFFLAPDNGILSLILRNGSMEDLRVVTNDRFFLKPVSHTFHGRDIFAPVSGHLAKGVTMSELGKRLALDEIEVLDVAVPIVSDEAIIGEIISKDRFGNLITNIDHKTYQDFTEKRASQDVVVQLGNASEINGVTTSYDTVEVGAPTALFGSRALLEIAVNQADASAYFGVSVGQAVILKTVRNVGRER
jgi:S-adenosylmethionine hydrolase